MKLTIEKTDTTVEVDGVPCRVWLVEGRPDVMVLVHRVLVDNDADQEPFASELLARPPAKDVVVHQEPWPTGGARS